MMPRVKPIPKDTSLEYDPVDVERWQNIQAIAHALQFDAYHAWINRLPSLGEVDPGDPAWWVNLPAGYASLRAATELFLVTHAKGSALEPQRGHPRLERSPEVRQRVEEFLERDLEAKVRWFWNLSAHLSGRENGAALLTTFRDVTRTADEVIPPLESELADEIGKHVAQRPKGEDAQREAIRAVATLLRELPPPARVQEVLAARVRPDRARLVEAVKHQRMLPMFDVIMERFRIPADEIAWNELVKPLPIELIWSYWLEEGMLVQTLNAVARRYQNRRSVPYGSPDPLAQLETSPLRQLNDVLWGYIEDEPHRLSVSRRAYEYDHHYGLPLHGRTASALNTADSRTRFTGAFHDLLAACLALYEELDHRDIRPDGFPVLHALKTLQLVLGEAMHNQYGRLPWVARREMMMVQEILAQPELGKFIGGREMIAYPEPWMDRVDGMKRLFGWTDASAFHFADLARFGETILLGVRFGGWTAESDAMRAAVWADRFRDEIRGYVEAYRVVTGVDLSAKVSPSNGDERRLPPSLLIRRRMLKGGGRAMREILRELDAPAGRELDLVDGGPGHRAR